MLSFNLIYNLEAVAALLKIFMWLALVHFQKYWLLIELIKKSWYSKSEKKVEVQASNAFLQIVETDEWQFSKYL